ncbi:MAG: DUF1592 domain-containing protein [Akkermansiaceae bacterium]
MLLLPADEVARHDLIGEFLSYHCYDCHDEVTQKGEREFESLKLPITSLEHLIMAQEIVDQVTLKEMPPKDEEQPTDEERLELLGALRAEITSARDRFKSTGGKTVMRRLTPREYENSFEVLFGRRVDTLGLTLDFPKEKTSHHLDNIGDTLVTSGFLLDQYLQSAHRLVETRLMKPEIEAKHWHFKGNFKQYEELSGSHRGVFNYRYLNVYEQPDTDTRQGSYGHIEDFLEGVPVSGTYEIKVLVQAMHRDTHYDPKIFGIDLSEPFQLGVVPGDVTKGHIHYPQRIEPVLAQTTVPDEKPEWTTFKVWLEVGQTPRFIFPNGPYESRRSIIDLNKRYKDEFKNPSRDVSRAALLREGKLPHIRISEIKIHGPLPEPEGTAEEIAVFGKNGFKEENAITQLEDFARRAFRRTLNEKDRARITGFHQNRISEKASPRQAAADTVKFILCSPSFFYLQEITPENSKALGQFDLASRLSFALWASPPDEHLFQLAKKGQLADIEVLSREIDCMLSDDRIREFESAFLDSWLNLRDLGNAPPPRDRARFYYAEALPVSMKEEVRLFFSDLLKSDGSIKRFLDSDYTFVDKKLAKHYKLPELKTLRLKDGFRRVKLDKNSHRGGLLGMGAILTASANGVETSPITRGVFVSENLLGIIPPPPPDEVPAIEPDTRGAKTIRDRLEKHLTSKACAECHRKIDPPGYALEQFDELGRWRTHYRGKNKSPKLKIDATGAFPSGETFDGVDGLNGILAGSRFPVFRRHLISTFLSYATGRRMEAVDRFEIEEIEKQLEKEGNGLRTLIKKSLLSDIFRNR